MLSSTESHLGLLNSIVRSTERSLEGELCYLGKRRKVSASRLLYEVYHRVDRPMNEYLYHFVSARNSISSRAFGELALVIPLCRISQVSRSFMPAAARLWNVLPSGVFNGGTLSSFKSTMNMCLLRISLIFCIFILIFYCGSLACLVS